MTTLTTMYLNFITQQVIKMTLIMFASQNLYNVYDCQIRISEKKSKLYLSHLWIWEKKAEENFILF